MSFAKQALRKEKTVASFLEGYLATGKVAGKDGATGLSHVDVAEVQGQPIE